MLKRPAFRKKVSLTTPFVKPTCGVVHDILNVKPIEERVRNTSFQVQNADLYVRLLERNYKECGVPFKKPDVSELEYRNRCGTDVERHFEYPDRVVVKLNVLKSGVVRVKILSQMANLWEKYYQKSKTPPAKSVIAAYKHMGYSENFIQKLSESFEKKKLLKKKYEKIIEKIFEKASKKKPVPVVKKMEEKKEKDMEEPEEDDENDEDDVQPEEDEGIDVEDEEEMDDDVIDDIEPVDLD